MVLLILLPFIDRNPERHPVRRPVAMLAAVVTVSATAYLTILGPVAGSPSVTQNDPDARQVPGPRVSTDLKTRAGERFPRIGVRIVKFVIAESDFDRHRKGG